MHGAHPFGDLKRKVERSARRARNYNSERNEATTPPATGTMEVELAASRSNSSEYGLGDELQIAIAHQAAALPLVAKHYMYAKESIALVALQARRALVRRPSGTGRGQEYQSVRAAYDIWCVTRMLVA